MSRGPRPALRPDHHGEFGPPPIVRCTFVICGQSNFAYRESIQPSAITRFLSRSWPSPMSRCRRAGIARARPRLVAALLVAIFGFIEKREVVPPESA